MNLDDLLKSIREEDDDSKGAKIDPEKFLKRKTFENPLKGQQFTAPSIPGAGVSKPVVKTVIVNIEPDKLIPPDKEKTEVSQELIDKLDELISVIKDDNELEEDRQNFESKAASRKKREEREKRIEKDSFSTVKNTLGVVKKNIGNVMDTVIRFLVFTLLGGLVTFISNFLKDPKNKKFIEDAQKFLFKDIPKFFEDAKEKLQPVIDWFKELIPKIRQFAEDFRLLLARFPFIGQFFATEEEKNKGLPSPPGTTMKPGQGFPLPNVGPGGIPMIIPFATGGLAMGTDTVPAMLTPGEFIMSRGAVNMFGVDTMMAINKAGGGTNRPKFGIVPGYSGGGIIQDLRDEMDRRGISDAKTRAMYLAQFKEESGLKLKSEMSYRNTSADRIRGLFYNARNMSNAEIDALKKNDVAFFNHMYGDMLDNRGEGYKYRGRGYIQLTGRDNYRTIGKAIGVDLESNPDLLLDHDVALKASFEYMRSRVSKSALKNGDIRAVTLAINGGYNGLQQREQYYNEFLPQEIEYLKNKTKSKKTPPPGLPDLPPSAPPPVVPTTTVAGSKMGPAFGDDLTALKHFKDLNEKRQYEIRKDENFQVLINTLRRFLPLPTPNQKSSSNIMVLPSVKQDTSNKAPVQSNKAPIPEFTVSSGIKMRTLVGKSLGIEDLVS